MTYDKLGRMLTSKDQRVHTTTYSYNAFGQQKTVRDPLGHKTESKVDLTGDVLSSKDKRGSVTRYRYDDNRRLVEKRTPLELKSGKSRSSICVQTGK